ncbi:MAG: MotA/TolQ/ExbB proton channel family protein [Novosphingobium sp.]|uniref:MotA/TolQ/ExbB proton channel family protein n=1 Tax=Novosphingobium sp. TaxID=1874826 RepID=UPI003C7A81BE
MNLISLIDGPSALIVLGGTLLSTVLRAGWGDCAVTLAKLVQLGRSGFDAQAARAELGRQIQEIRKDGLYRANPHRFGDAEFDEATEALIHQRSIPALLAAHEAHKARRLGEAERAVRTLAQAAELAPVFGLAGTLISLSQLPADGIAHGALTGAISMAVITTLYGLLSANLVLAPLARMVERKSAAEEVARQAMIDWLAQQIARDMPPTRRTSLTAVPAEAV